MGAITGAITPDGARAHVVNRSDVTASVIGAAIAIATVIATPVLAGIAPADVALVSPAARSWRRPPPPRAVVSVQDGRSGAS
ncbi:hypothetical protein [Streptosporangium sp. V21-05]|uniref:hypothetical protein n=1 Tax=Streptosporangium sp. V21-05 TaxID=3446115 RepID=UPI003F52EEA2